MSNSIASIASHLIPPSSMEDLVLSRVDLDFGDRPQIAGVEIANTAHRRRKANDLLRRASIAEG